MVRVTHDHVRLCLRCGENPRDTGSSFCEECKDQVITGKPPRRRSDHPPVAAPKPKPSGGKPKATDDGYAAKWRKTHASKTPRPLVVKSCNRCGQDPRVIGSTFCEACREALTTGQRDPTGCFFCSVPKSGFVMRNEPLCDDCRANLSRFLVFLGRKPLPERTPR